jgi:hypothetical protein
MAFFYCDAIDRLLFSRKKSFCGSVRINGYFNPDARCLKSVIEK